MSKSGKRGKFRLQSSSNSFFGNSVFGSIVASTDEKYNVVLKSRTATSAPSDVTAKVQKTSSNGVPKKKMETTGRNSHRSDSLKMEPPDRNGEDSANTGLGYSWPSSTFDKNGSRSDTALETGRPTSAQESNRSISDQKIDRPISDQFVSITDDSRSDGHSSISDYSELSISRMNDDESRVSGQSLSSQKQLDVTRELTSDLGGSLSELEEKEEKEESEVNNNVFLNGHSGHSPADDQDDHFYYNHDNTGRTIEMTTEVSGNFGHSDDIESRTVEKISTDQFSVQLNDHTDRCVDHSNVTTEDDSFTRGPGISPVEHDHDLAEDVAYLEIQSGADSEGIEPEYAESPGFVRSDDNEVDEPDHPYFVRMAAEAAGPTPIISSRGTIRGVKNRVRAGIASLLEKQEGKKAVNYTQLEKGKVVFYTTSVTVVRETFDKCLTVKKILQTQMVDFEERDILMSKAMYDELTDRLHPDAELPQVFVDGYHLGDAKEMVTLNENGTLRKIFKNFQKVQHAKCCTQCGGYRYIPCTSCHGSKKTKRNFFTNEFCALRCIACDNNGLLKCNKCNVVDDDTTTDNNAIADHNN